MIVLDNREMPDGINAKTLINKGTDTIFRVRFFAEIFPRKYIDIFTYEQTIIYKLNKNTAKPCFFIF
jgi:hypothetical protein